MAESIFQTLRDLAEREGRIVLASAHCPSSTSFTLFTHLILLTADGRLAFQGPCGNDEALAFFTGPGLGFTPPHKHFNPADFYLALVSAAPGADPAEETARMDTLSEAFQASDMRLREPLPADNRCAVGMSCGSNQSIDWDPILIPNLGSSPPQPQGTGASSRCAASRLRLGRSSASTSGAAACNYHGE